MTVRFRKWASQSLSDITNREKSIPSRFFRPIYYVYVAILLSITKYFRWGTNVFERDWDALILLDACRVDTLREVADEYNFLNVDDSIRSVGSTSFEWMNHTFNAGYRDDIAETAYVSGNGYTDRVLGRGGDTGHAAMPFGPSEYDVVDLEEFGYLEELWRADFDADSEWMVGDGNGARVDPSYTTDRAIAAGRERDADRLVVHYMYPHDPYPLADPALQRPFDALRSGDVDRDDVWEAYLDNLRYVLDEVAVLLENLDAERVVVTADHGEAFGEYGFYRHVIGCPLPCMRRVPWAETSAKDSATYKPTAPAPTKTATDISVEERLEQLGYR